MASKDKIQHAAHLRQLFLRLREHGLVIYLEKCMFGARTIDFLGHRVTADGVSPLPSHVKARFPQARDGERAARFFGPHQFLQDCAAKASFTALQ